MHKNHRTLIYGGTIGIQERVLVRQGKRAIRVRAIEVVNIKSELIGIFFSL